jgi:acyl carrier protein
MSDDEILLALTGIVREVVGNDSVVLTPQMSAPDVEGWDSAANVMIVVATEMRFGVRFQTGEIDGVTGVGELVRLVRRKMA